MQGPCGRSPAARPDVDHCAHGGSSAGEAPKQARDGVANTLQCVTWCLEYRLGCCSASMLAV